MWQNWSIGKLQWIVLIDCRENLFNLDDEKNSDDCPQNGVCQSNAHSQSLHTRQPSDGDENK